jgi:hypothetical protein
MSPKTPNRKNRAPTEKKVHGNLRFTAARKAKFIDALRKTKEIAKACEAVGISRYAALRHRRNDEEFARQWEEVFETAVDQLEQSALDRAINGWDEPVFYCGEVVGYVRKFSTALTIFMLKSWRRDRYLFEQQVVQDADAVAEKLRVALKNMDTSVPEPPEEQET